VNVLLWHVHGSYTTALVHGGHDYWLPTLPGRGPDGRGRARTWDWPATVRELTPAAAADAPVDVVILQRPVELARLASEWLGGRRPGRDVPAIYLEHNTPPALDGRSEHPAADRDDVLVVHVTHCNALFWDTGGTRTRVIEHGIVDPGYRYTGHECRLAAVINEPVRRGRATGTDLLEEFEAAGPVDLFGIGAGALGGTDDLDQRRLHHELAQRRAYVHTARWTSLGLSLLEAMHLGVPVVALATTEVPRAVPPGCGFTSTSLDELVGASRHLLADPDAARAIGRRGREHARERYGLDRFLADWDCALKEVAA
jgi:hypothetical protein